jgi:hypothetical protein
MNGMTSMTLNSNSFLERNEIDHDGDRVMGCRPPSPSPVWRRFFDPISSLLQIGFKDDPLKPTGAREAPKQRNWRPWLTGRAATQLSNPRGFVNRRQRGSVPRSECQRSPNYSNPTTRKIELFKASQKVLTELQRRARPPDPPWWCARGGFACLRTQTYSLLSVALELCIRIDVHVLYSLFWVGQALKRSRYGPD